MHALYLVPFSDSRCRPCLNLLLDLNRNLKTGHCSQKTFLPGNLHIAGHAAETKKEPRETKKSVVLIYRILFLTLVK